MKLKAPHLDPFDRGILFVASITYLMGATAEILGAIYSDIMALFWNYVVYVNHSLPYANFTIEYPPPVGMLIWFSGLFTGLVPQQPQIGYGIVQALVIYPFAMAIAYYTLKIAEQIGTPKRLAAPLTVVSTTFLLFTFYNWDSPAVALMLGGIYYFMKKRPRIAYVLLSLATAVKIYPLILLPLFWMHSDDGWKPTARRVSLLQYFVYPLLLVYLPFIVLWPGSVINMLRVNFVTGANFWIEDSWVTYLNLFVFHGQYYLVRLTSYLLIACLGLLALHKFRNNRSSQAFVKTALLLVIAGLFGFTGVPPQFLLMVLPLLALVNCVNVYLVRLIGFMNALIIVMWFTFDRGPFGPIMIISTIRQWMLFGIYLSLLAQQAKLQRRG